VAAKVPLQLQAARRALAHQRPYLATAVWALQPVESKSCPTMAVDKWARLYYNPVLVEKEDTQRLAIMLYHEVFHVLRDHNRRAEAMRAEPLRYNIASDMEINDDLKSEGLSLPEMLLPEQIGEPDHRLAEEYYHKIKVQRVCGNCGRPKPEPGSGQGQSGKGKGGKGKSKKSGNQTDTNGSSSADESGSSGAGNQSNESQGGGCGGGKCDGNHDHGHGGQETCDCDPSGVGHGQCGSCAGSPGEWELPGPDDCDTPGVDEADLESIRHNVAKEIYEASKKRGNIPGHWTRWAEDRFCPQVDWRKQFRAMVRAAGRRVGVEDYSYSRPGRRRIPRVVMPSMVAPNLEIAIILDTSGSMSQDLLGQAMAEVRGILKTGGVDSAWLLEVDADLHNAKRIRDIGSFELHGGGGTDMRIGFDAALKLTPRPQVVICLSDCYTPWPTSFPIPTVIARIDNVRGEGGDVPKWAAVVNVKAEAKR